MPDHPSWPAELVEKVAAVLREPQSRSSRMDEAITDTAQAVLSALSGDLVPREEHAVALRWVGQEDAQGCGIAVLAMLTGQTYAEVKATIDAQDGHGHNGNWDTNGITHITLDRLLTAEGYFVQRRYDHYGGEWPPRPFAPVHFASVRQPSSRSHFVVVDAEGRVLDPLQEGVFSLADWEQVHNVVGLVRPGARSQADALAEALERLDRAVVEHDGYDADDWHEHEPNDGCDDYCELMRALRESRSRLASYRSKPAPGETE